MNWAKPSTMRDNLYVYWLFLSCLSLLGAQVSAQIQEVGVSLDYFDYTTQLSGWNPSRRIDRFPQLLGFNYDRQLTPFLALHFPVKLGKTPYYPGASEEQATPLWFVNFDAKVKLEWYPNAPRLSPYLTMGVGGYWISDVDNSGIHWRIPIGLGVNVLTWKRLYCFVETNYYRSFMDNDGSFSHGFGIRYRFGKSIRPQMPKIDVHISQHTDSDGDGVPDLQDQCPHQPGSAQLKGCPDSSATARTPQTPTPTTADADRDGVPDSVDKCPQVFGSVFNYGCPEDSAVAVEDSKSMPSTQRDSAEVVQPHDEEVAQAPPASLEQSPPSPPKQSDTLYQRIFITDTLYRTVTVYDTVIRQVIVYDTVYKTVHVEKPIDPKKQDHAVRQSDKQHRRELSAKMRKDKVKAELPTRRQALEPPIEKDVLSTTTLRFPYRVAALQKSHLPLLYEIVRQLKAHSEYRLVILPHSTDYKHPYYDNLLNKKRLSALRKFLKLKGIDDDRIEVRQIEERGSGRRAGWVRLWLKKA